MYQSKTVRPTIWNQLATKVFQEQEKRLITGLNGSMWFGTTHITHYVRTVFFDCSHGSEMQRIAILQHLHEVAMGGKALATRVQHWSRQHSERDEESICFL
eukprot:8306349-Lingulodinium_polyedra.AAC.1